MPLGCFVNTARSTNSIKSQCLQLESQNIEIWRLADRLHKENQESLQEETTDSVAGARKYLDELWGIKKRK